MTKDLRHTISGTKLNAFVRAFSEGLMKLSHCALAAVVALANLEAVGSYAAVDQELVPLEATLVLNVGATNTIDWAQTWTVGVTGVLTGFDVWVENTDPAIVQPLLFDVRTTLGGAPTEPDAGSNILVSGSIPASEIPLQRRDYSPPETLLHVDVSAAAIQVTAGDVLAIVLRSDDPSPHPNGVTYSWYGLLLGGSIQPLYPGGQAYLRTSGNWEADGLRDATFRTYVTPIPEPAIGVQLIACALFAGAGRHWRVPPVRNRYAARVQAFDPPKRPNRAVAKSGA